ncbi:hypothetical protein KP79_PYT20393 [Mizuhopecten yessoensis]|uniref:Uncharacterized protein n=1 Tax=Mizuhopecten yessoensis TaxID=6573 RepID=A0A210QLN6_MIZYE|nr:hypothetical protein KP79_PYT20393 [Mizuhopecten yessoensis]
MWEGYELPMFDDIESVKHFKQAVKYCSKEDYLCDLKGIDHDLLSTLKLAWCYAQKVDILNPLHYPFCRLIPGEQRKFTAFFDMFIHDQEVKKMKADMNDCILYPWQRKCIEELENQGNRKVFWLYDDVGNQGKTFLAQYLAAHKNCLVLENGGKKDLAFDI